MQTFKAWDLIGFDGTLESITHLADPSLELDRFAPRTPASVRIKGGRTLYESVVFNDDTRGDRVRLDRLVAEQDGLRVVNRYVDPDTELEVVSE